MTQNANARFQEGIRHQNAGQLEDARKIFLDLAKELPKETPIHIRLGQVAFSLGQLNDAAIHFKEALQRQPQNPDTLANLGVICRRLGQFDQARLYQEQAIAADPNYVIAYINLGILLHENLHQPAHALECFEKALEISPEEVKAWSNKGTVLQSMGNFADSELAFRQAIQYHPTSSDTHFLLGNLLADLDRDEEAVACYEQAIRFQTKAAESYCNMGSVLKKLNRVDEARTCYEKAIALNPDLPDAHYNLGNLLQQQGRLNEAAAAYKRCQTLQPENVNCLSNYGDALMKLRRYTEAEALYDQALALEPLKHATTLNRGNLYYSKRDYPAALAAYERTLEIDPDTKFIRGHYLYTKLHVGDWAGFDGLVSDLTEDIMAGKPVSAPFAVLALVDDPQIQQKAIETFVGIEYPVKDELPPPVTHPEHGRIKIGYFSTDYWNHPVAHLMLGLFAAHDRSRFEVIAFSLGNPIKDKWHQRVKDSVDQFIEIRDMSDKEVAELARSMEIDIAVDLNGFTENCRAGIFAQRAAPVQVSYIGYLGTMGAPYIDYLVTDETIVPPEARPFYTEKMIYLPSYQINDPEQHPSERPMTRAEFGLPEDAFVFCAFNNNYKITPPVFVSWMRILNRVPHGVLWLYVSNERAQALLREEAKRQGVDPSRLIFAKKIVLEEHLARQRLGDLFLDTLPYNAGATASNALRVGLPVLTRTGKSFAGRMGSSLLKAVGLPELITATEQEYEDKAVELAQDPALMQAIRQKLATNLPNSALFDNQAFARNIETAFTTIHQRACQGLPPMHVKVQD